MWPEPLIEELAARRCIIFLGAGASAGCTNNESPPKHSPTWKQLLDEFKTAIGSKLDTKVVDDLLAKEKFLDAAEVLVSHINTAEFTSITRKTFAQPKFNPSKIHKSILELDPKIVVTTNFDDIYDNYCKSGAGNELYNICKYYEDHLVSDLRSPVRLIIKAHGCVTAPAKMVLSRSQYFKERQEHSNFYQVLDALFLTHTILFIGYSISDPDIQLLLENSTIAYKSSHTHYALIQDNLHEAIASAHKRSYNLDFIKFPVGEYTKSEDMIDELKQKVIARRTRNPA